MPESPEAGSDIVERVHYDANQRRVDINKAQNFANVPSDVWSFHVGGYQVCEKWPRTARAGSQNTTTSSTTNG